MKCPFCNNELINGYCDYCKKHIHDSYHLQTQNDDIKNEQVLEPEIVDENENSGNHYNRARAQGFGNFRQSPIFTQVVYNNVTVNNSCLTSLISLFLIFVVFFQMGFLAALGFTFFLVVGKLIAFIININSMLKGKIIPAQIFDVAIWVLSYLLVKWLA